MTKKQGQIKALRESKAHWRRMKADPWCGEEPTRDDCALCELQVGQECGDCPIAVNTGEDRCMDTPFVWAKDARSRLPIRRPKKITPEHRTLLHEWACASTAMIAYLDCRERELKTSS